MAANVTIGADVAEVIQAGKAFVASLTTQQAAVTDLAGKLVEFNAKGEVTKVVIKEISASGAKVTQTFKEVKGVLTEVTTKVDAVSGSSKKLAKDTGDAGDAGEKSGKKFFIAFDGLVRLFESQVIRQGFQGIITQFTEGAKAAVDFSLRIAEIQTISQRSGVSTKEWSDAIRDLSIQFGRPEADVAEGAYQAISNQVVEGRNSFVFLTDALRFSQAAVSSTADAVNLLSSVIKGFSLDSADAERVSASLFKTIELGRLRASDIANTYGRVGIVASKLGVSFNEVNAALATLTVQGVLPSDAITFLTNVMNKLLDPTKEMKVAFERLGVSSGPQLVQSLGGFSGFLKFLDTESARGTQRLDELLGSIRALKGAAGLTGNAFDLFETNLEKITSGTAEFRAAVDIVGESLGKRTQKQLQEAKIFFEKDFGEPLARILLGVVEDLGGARNALNLLFTAIKQGIPAFFAYKVAVVATAGAQAALTTSTASAAAATTAVGTAATAAIPKLVLLRSAAVGVGSALAILALFNKREVGNFIIGGETEAFSAAVQRTAIDIEERDQRLKKSTEKRIQEEKDKENEFSAALTKEIETRYRTLLNQAGRIVKLSFETKDAQIKHLREISEQAKATGQTYTSFIAERLSTIKGLISESQNNITESIKQIQNLQDKTGKTTFDFRIGIANEQQQFDLIERRITDLTERAKTLFATNTKESVDEARKLYDEIERLEIQRFQKDVDIQKRRFEETGVGPTIVSPDLATGQGRVQLLVSTEEIERRINQLAKERIELEKRFQQTQRDFQETARETAQVESERLKRLQDLIKQAVEFSAISPETGQLEARFRQGAQGQQLTALEASQKAALEFERLITKIQQESSNGELANFQFFADLQRQKQAILQQVQAVARSEQAKTAQQEILNQEKGTLEFKRKTEEGINDAKRKAEELRKTLEADLGGLESITNVGRKTLGLPFVRLFGAPGRETEEIARAEAAKEEAQRLIKEAQQIGLDLAKAPNIELAKSFNEVAGRAAAAVDSFIKLRTSLSTEAGKPTLPGAGPGGQTAEEFIQQFGERTRLLVAQFGIIEDGKSKLQSALETFQRLNKETEPLGNSFINTGEAARIAGTRIVDSFEQANVRINEFTERVKTLQKELDTLNIKSPFGLIPSQDRNVGGLIRYFQSGGFARGKDQFPAMLSAGEMVMTSEATRAFFPLLAGMNAKPKHFNSGGSVTNIGDINITVPGGQTDQQTMRNIAEGLRRGIRRGQFKIGD